jgi:hypothetical protein
MKLFALLIASCLSLPAADVPPIAGDWLGTITFNGVDQRLAVHFRSAGDSWTGSLDAVDSGVLGSPLQGVSFAEAKLSFRVPKIQASYEGTLDGKTGIISGAWSQSGLKLPLDQHRMTAGQAAPRRPQEPKPPFPYEAENVAYDNPQAAGVRLAGTFTRPRGNGPFTTVLLITGSGPQNRDEEVMGHKPFLVLSDYPRFWPCRDLNDGRLSEPVLRRPTMCREPGKKLKSLMGLHKVLYRTPVISLQRPLPSVLKAIAYSCIAGQCRSSIP